MKPGNLYIVCGAKSCGSNESRNERRTLPYSLFHSKEVFLLHKSPERRITLIDIKNLNKYYENGKERFHALKDINLKIEQGEIFGVIGSSGAGKSTLIRTINLLEKPSSGNIFIDGTDITALGVKELRDRRKKMGMIFQSFNLFDSKTVFRNIAYPLEISGASKDHIEKKVNELLSVVGLQDKKNLYPSNLSGGQKQRVAIARALANDPDVLLCDEATSALDPKTTNSILELLKEVQSRYKITIMLITHEMEVIKEICNRVAIIESGEIVELGSVTQVFSNPKSKIAKDFVSNINHSPDEVFAYKTKDDSKLIRLSFVGDIAQKSLISQSIRKFDIDINILSGDINKLQSTKIGYLVSEFSGNTAEVETCLEWFRQNGVETEVIKNESIA